MCAVGALMHLAIPLGGPDWYRLAGAPPGLVAMATEGRARPVVSSVVIACILTVFAAYAFSALGLLRRLPATRAVLAITGAALSVRGLWFPVLAVRAPLALSRFCGRCGELNAFVVGSSALCVFIGVGYLLGAWRPDLAMRPGGHAPAAGSRVD